MKTNLLLPVALLALVLAGCGTTGKKFEIANYDKIERGESTKAEVKELIGEPYSIMQKADGEEQWTYMHSKYSYSLVDTFFALKGIEIDPRMTENSQVLVVFFDKNDVVSDFASYERKGLSRGTQASPQGPVDHINQRDESADLLNIGLGYVLSGELEKARWNFEKAIEKDPQFFEAHYCLGITHDDLGQYQQAIESYKQAILIKPGYAEVHYNLGCSYGELGRHQDAIEAFQHAIQINPDYAKAYHNLCCNYGELGRYQQAIEACKQAISIKPDYADAHRSLGGAYYSNGDKASALDEYGILKTLDPRQADKLLDFIGEDEAPRTICPQCQGIYSINFKFCPKCGVALTKPNLNSEEEEEYKGSNL